MKFGPDRHSQYSLFVDWEPINYWRNVNLAYFEGGGTGNCGDNLRLALREC